MTAHDPKQNAREKAGWGLPVPAPSGAHASERIVDELFAAPTGAGAEADPVASLFQDNRALPAPSIADLQSEAELTRWRANGRSSLFGDSVPDPAPAHGGTAPALRGVGTFANPVAGGMGAPPPVPAAARRPTPSKASPPPVPVSVSMASLAAAAPASLAPGVEIDEEKTRKRRIERGPKKSLLAAIGAAAVLTLGSAAVVLRMIPNPVGAASEGPAHAARAALPVTKVPSAPPMTVPVHAFKPAPMPVQAPTAVAAPVAAPAAPTAVAAPAAAAAPPSAVAAADAPASAVTRVPAAVVATHVPALTAVAPVKVQPVNPEPKPPVTPVADVAAPVAKAAATDPPDSNAGGAENQRLVATASKLLAEDNPSGAEALMREALVRDPDDHHAMEVLVRSLIDQDRGKEAVPYARKMVQRRGKRVAYRLLLGDALLMTGDENGARRAWKAALDLEPNDRQIRMRLGL